MMPGRLPMPLAATSSFRLSRTSHRPAGNFLLQHPCGPAPCCRVLASIDQATNQTDYKPQPSPSSIYRLPHTTPSSPPPPWLATTPSSPITISTRSPPAKEMAGFLPRLPPPLPSPRWAGKKLPSDSSVLHGHRPSCLAIGAVPDRLLANIGNGNGMVLAPLLLYWCWRWFLKSRLWCFLL
jgi:hypothetical protein